MAGEGVFIVIPARGGSRGLPRKNARSLGGMPLLEWTARAVRAAGLDGATCLLSTDDPEIAEIGRSVGLDAPFIRPAALATDHASVESVAIHAVEWLNTERGVYPRVVMLLQPTSPFRPPACLREAIAIMSGHDVPGVLGVKPVHRSPRTLFHADDGLRLTAMDPTAAASGRRQDIRPLYTPNGALYSVPVPQLKAPGGFFPEHCRALVMDQVASLDIDDACDWAIAEAVANAGLTWRGSMTGA